MSRSMVFTLRLRGSFGGSEGDEPLACRNVTEELSNTASTARSVYSDVCLSDMGRCSLHVVPGCFIKTMRVEIGSQSAFGEVKIPE